MQLTRRQFGKGTLALAASAPIAGIGIAGCSTSWITTVMNDMPIIINIINSILSVITVATGNGTLATAAGAIVTQAATALSASLAALQDAVNAYHATPGASTTANLIAALKVAQADVQKVVQSLPAGTVNATVETVLVAGIGTVITILSAIQSLIPGAAPVAVQASMASSVSKAGPVVLPNGAALSSGFNSVLILNGFGAQAVR